MTFTFNTKTFSKNSDWYWKCATQLFFVHFSYKKKLLLDRLVMNIVCLEIFCDRAPRQGWFLGGIFEIILERLFRISSVNNRFLDYLQLTFCRSFCLYWCCIKGSSFSVKTHVTLSGGFTLEVMHVPRNCIITP